MEDLIPALLKQVPALVVLAWVVKNFLDHLKEARAESRKVTEDYRQSSERMMSDFRETCAESRTVQLQAIEAIAHNTEALNRLEEAVTRVEEEMETEHRESGIVRK